MARINSFDLVSGRKIPFEDFIIHQPSLEEIRSVGYEEYNSYLNIMMVSMDDFIDEIILYDSSDNSEDKNELLDELRNNYEVYDLIVKAESTRELLKDALSFFLCGVVEYSSHNNSFLIFKSNDSEKNYGVVNRGNFNDVKRYVATISFLSTEDIAPKKFRNKISQKIYEKIQKHKREANKNKPESTDMNIPNIIASVSAAHSSYNLTNIWSLTVYQLYDQFFRLHNNIQLKIVGNKWAAWGDKDFDFSVWYKELNFDK